MTKPRTRLPLIAAAATTGVLCLGAALTAQASSHREAPFITNLPKVDATDFYMFRSYGEGAESNTVTLIANYLPLQDAYGGPNYFTLDEDAIYEIHIDNTGDGVEDITFQFDFNNEYQGLAVDAATGDEEVMTTVPLFNIGQIPGNPGVLNVKQTYSVTVINGDRRSSATGLISHTDGGGTTFVKPVDNIGMKSIPDYEDYIQTGNGGGGFIYDVTIPGCSGGGTAQGQLFVGQRAEGFVVNLGETFDLINVNGSSPPVTGITDYTRSSDSNILEDKNITTLALQVPSDCLTSTGEPSIGGWTTASLPQARVLNPAPTGYSDASVDGGPYTQLSRLGMPLVNEVVIGLDKKNAFNASEPKGDGQFLQFVTYPSLPVLVNVLFPAVPVPETPRTDLVAAFLTGLTLKTSDGAVVFSNQVGSATPSEMLRLNTAVAPVPLTDQNSLGLLACDVAGFPNGRRPFDDVVDIELTVAEGALTPTTGPALQTCAVADGTPGVINAGVVVTDGALPDRDDYLTRFPYLDVPHPGSPTGPEEG